MRARPTLAALVGVLVLGCEDPSGEELEPSARFLMDEGGRALILHGANQIDDFEPNSFEARPGVIERGDVALMASLGFDVVRLPRLWHVLEPEQDAIDFDYVDRTVELLDWFGEEEILVVLDMHQDIYGPTFGGRGAPRWAVRDDGLPFEPQDPWWMNNLEPAVQACYDHFYTDADLRQEFVDAWMELVHAAAGHPALLGYDLQNEPFQGTFGMWEFEAEVLNDFYQRLIDEIRLVDREAWIFFEPNAWVVNSGFSDSDLEPLAGERLAYFPHLYRPDIHEGGAYTGPTGYLDTWAERRLEEAERLGTPVLIGELGAFWDGEGHDDWVRAVLAMADEVTAGWTMWHFGFGGGFDIVDEDRSFYPIADAYVRTYARRVAGEPEEHRFDPETREMVLTYRNRRGVRGPTVIFVPESRLYPEGWTLETSDPEGRWSSEWSPDREILTVEHDPESETHRIRISPAS